MPKVSVIIPSYNAARYISAAINSVLMQTYKDYEIVVVNDGSTDDTEEVLKPYMDRIRYFYQENKGEKGAKNTGISHATGEYIALLDSDDLWVETKLEKQVAILDSSGPEVGAVYTDYFYFINPGIVFGNTAFNGRPIPDNEGYLYEHILFRPNDIGAFVSQMRPSTIVYRKAVFDSLGLFNGDYRIGGDWEYQLRSTGKYKYVFIPEPLLYYRDHPGAVTKHRKLYSLCYFNIANAELKSGRIPAHLSEKFKNEKWERLLLALCRNYWYRGETALGPKILNIVKTNKPNYYKKYLAKGLYLALKFYFRNSLSRIARAVWPMRGRRFEDFSRFDKIQIDT